jgi:hypothetical protein
LAVSEEIAASAVRTLSTAGPAGQAGANDAVATWAKDAAPLVLDRVGAALLAGDTRVLLDHLGAEFSELRRTGVPEVHLLGLLDALAAGIPDELAPARQILCDGRDHLLRAGAQPFWALRYPAASAVAGAAAGAAGDAATTVTGATWAAAAGPARAAGEAGTSPAHPQTGAGGVNVLAGQPPGQAFSDLLLLGALACQAPVALLSVPQPGGTWSTLPFGLSSQDRCTDGHLFLAVACSEEPLEIPDLLARQPRSPLAVPPNALRWAYGVALRRDPETVMGVVVVLDRRVRQAGPSERRGLEALARQVGAQLLQWSQLGQWWLPPAGVGLPGRDGESSAGRSSHPAGSAPGGRADPGRRVSGVSPAGRPAEALSKPAGVSLAGRADFLGKHQVARIFNVTDRPFVNWAAAGTFPSLRTVGGHLQFRRGQRVTTAPAGSRAPVRLAD